MVVTFKSEDYDQEEIGATKLRTKLDMSLRPFGSPDPTLVKDFGWLPKSRAEAIAKENGARFIEL